MDLLIACSEDQCRQYLDAVAVFRAHALAQSELQQVRGSMLWREVGGKRYLIRTSAKGAQKSLGPANDDNQAVYDRFMARKEQCLARSQSLSEQLQRMQRRNKADRVGRVPEVVVSILKALERHGLADDFITVGTHALYAYEAACGVHIDSAAMATRDIDLLYDTRRHMQFVSTMRKLDSSLLGVLQKADKTFRLLPDQLQTAVNNQGFEVDIIRRVQHGADPHPLRMSDFSDDLWAVQVPSGNRLVSARRFEQVVVSTAGHMALMRTVHPLDFIQVKRALSKAPGRDPLKARKDALQAEVVQHLWDEYLQYASGN